MGINIRFTQGQRDAPTDSINGVPNAL